MIDASKAEEFMQRITPGNELDDMEGVSHSQGSQSQRPMSQSQATAQRMMNAADKQASEIGDNSRIDSQSNY